MKTDAQIQADVMQELRWDPSVNHEHIGVAVTGGVVTLTGLVPYYIEKLSAEQAAEKVAGVKAVVEKIEVKIPGVHTLDDQDLAKAVVNQLRWHSQIPEERVKATVQDGWVELSGEVEWEYQRRAAAKAIRGLRGLRGIRNHIRINAKPIESAAVKARIEEALQRAAEREAARVDVDVHGSRVVLSGRVRSLADLRSIRGAAFNAPGVAAVDIDKLTVIT